MGACGSATPTAPSAVSGDRVPTSDVRGLGVSATGGAFATAPDSATLKVTSPTPQSPGNGTTISGLNPTLSVAMSAGEYVQAPGLQLGFAVWRMEDDGRLTLVEADTVPQTDGTTTYAVGSALGHDAGYRWRARAVLDGAFGPWSNVATFSTPAPPPPPPPPGPPVPSDPQARYRAVFESDWSAATHTQDYPDNAHYSPMIGATHLATTTFWQAGMLASSGIERMAEEGSLVSMIAPSPDWFVGVDGLPLIAKGQWRDEVVVPLFPCDAGTDVGASYDATDADAAPATPVSPLLGPPVAVNGTVAPFGRFIFRRLN